MGAALGTEFRDENMYRETQNAIARFREKHGALTFALGECMNGDPFALAVALIRMGYGVSEIYGTVTDENFVYVQHLAKLSPELRIYSNLEPTMLHYDCSEAGADVTIGKDAGYYHPGCPNLPWNEDVQPFGYAGLRKLLCGLDQVLSEKEKTV